MLILDLIQSVLDAQFTSTGLPVCAPLPPGTISEPPCVCSGFFNFTSIWSFGMSTYCPGQAFTPIAAAYQTQGMWAQADLIAQIMYTKLGSLASLLYVIAAIGGLIGVALGAPPKMYLWFFFGPAIFHWLLGATYPVKGTQWSVANRPQNQREVWKLAEVGLLNSNWKYNAVNVYKNKEPSGSVDVSLFFAVYDDLVSGVIQNLISWTGMYNMRQSTQPDAETTVGRNSSVPNGRPIEENWFLLTNSKWEMIENITGAKFGSPHARDALVNFFAGKCGDAFARQLDSGKFINALYGRKSTVPDSIFQGVAGRGGPEDPLSLQDYNNLYQELSTTYTTTPRSLKHLIAEAGKKGSFHDAFDWRNRIDERITYYESIGCQLYFQIMASAFRWEAGHIYHQFFRSAPKGLTEEQVIFNLLYGWDVNKLDSGNLKHLTPDESSQFLMNLILVHLVRNEMQLINFQSITLRDASTETTRRSAEGHLRYVATKNKFQEVYQWAKMVPHMQGVLLYYLAMAYPFACLMMIMPGQYKMLFTWMSFWAWAKLWDLGFAVVTALERSVWATIGNNSDIQKHFQRIAALNDWGMTFSSPVTSSGADCNAAIASCPLAHVTLSDCVNAGGQAAACTLKSVMDDPVDAGAWLSSTRIFDRAMAVASSLDLDLSNSYYIYIMAGLYFAVPVVTGQMVLGAKAGATSFVNNIIGAVGQEAGRQAASGFQSDMVYRMKTNMASTGQAAWIKAMGAGNPALGQMQDTNPDGTPKFDKNGNPVMRNRGYAEAAGRYANQQALSQFGGSEADAHGRITDMAANSYFLGKQKFGANSGALMSGLRLAAGAPAAVASFLPGGREAAARGTATSRPGQGTAAAGNAPAQAAAAAAGGGDGTPAWMNTAGHIADIGQRHQIGLGYDNSAKKDQALAQLEGTKLGFSGNSTMYGQAENRMRGYGNYEAEMASWEASNAYANQFNAQASALGLFAGGLDPGRKPSDQMGMSMSGELGHEAHRQAWFMDPGQPGGFGSRIESGVSDVMNHSQDVGRAYDSGSPTSTIGPSIVGTGAVAQDMGEGTATAVGAALQTAAPVFQAVTGIDTTSWQSHMQEGRDAIRESREGRGVDANGSSLANNDPDSFINQPRFDRMRQESHKPPEP